MRIHRAARACLVLSIGFLTHSALADPTPAPEPSAAPAAPAATDPTPQPNSDDSSPTGNPPPLAEAPVPSSTVTGPPPNPPERGFLFAVEPSVPAPNHVVFNAGLGNVSRSGEERPVGSGSVFPTLGAEVGLISRLSVYAEGGVVSIQEGNPGQLASPFLFDSGVHILLTNPNSQMWRLSLRPSYSYDVTGASTANFTATLGWKYRKVKVIASGMASHTFQDGADPVDLQATLGGTYALPYGFRVGVEGVWTDLEEIATPGAEGGASAFGGPTAGWQWDRLQVVLGPAWGITPGAIYDNFLFRGAISLRL